jgi:hypothetical protein
MFFCCTIEFESYKYNMQTIRYNFYSKMLEVHATCHFPINTFPGPHVMQNEFLIQAQLTILQEGLNGFCLACAQHSRAVLVEMIVGLVFDLYSCCVSLGVNLDQAVWRVNQAHSEVPISLRRCTKYVNRMEAQIDSLILAIYNQNAMFVAASLCSMISLTKRFGAEVLCADLEELFDKLCKAIITTKNTNSRPNSTTCKESKGN